MIHKAHHAGQPRRRGADYVEPMEEINRLEDERARFWRDGVKTRADQERLQEINRELSGLWARRRQELAGGRR